MGRPTQNLQTGVGVLRCEYVMRLKQNQVGMTEFLTLHAKRVLSPRTGLLVSKFLTSPMNSTRLIRESDKTHKHIIG